MLEDCSSLWWSLAVVWFLDRPQIGSAEVLFAAPKTLIKVLVLTLIFKIPGQAI